MRCPARRRPTGTLALTSTLLVAVALSAVACTTPATQASAPAATAPLPAESALPTPIAPVVESPVAGPDAPVEVALSTTDTAETQPGGLQVGITHTQSSLDSWDDAASVARARAVVPLVADVQNQHLMGWGTLTPMPGPGVYDWWTLDRRVATMLSTGGTPVITLCCSPDWMKGGTAGTTDWTRLEVAPRQEHFDDFAELARQVALRYPQVRHFMVWNEMKGFWDATRNRWNVELYTELYNKVYAALKSVDPAISVGGPYIPMVSWGSPAAVGFPSALRGTWGIIDQRALDVITYWLANADGADFIVVDGGSGTRDQGLLNDEFADAEKYRAISEWISERTPLPVWWAEWYPVTGDLPADPVLAQQRIAAIVATGLVKHALGGTAVALHWAPQQAGATCGTCLWSTPRTAGGGHITLTGEAVATIRDFLDGPADLAVLAHAAPNLLAVSSGDQVLVVNQSTEDRRVSVDGTIVHLGPYAVTAVEVPRT